MGRCDYDTMVVKIKSQMEKIGINARELADKASVGKSFVYDILSGKSTNPTSKKLMAIAKVLEVPLSYLVSSENNFHEGENIIPISPVHYLELRDDELLTNRTVIYLPLNTKLSLNVKELRIYNMQGDSMSPTLLNQDFVLIDTGDKTPHPAGLFIINDAVGISVRRLEYVRDMDKSIKLHIVADNKKYSSYECHINDINILGRVIWYARPL